ncbi:hypothetical protein [Nonomuraea dietziae]|uniref:hypothetical protein n=1 Tax=Nonomuraea dietziae TaxID=65515 RepID=UPI0031D46FBD
MPGQKALNSLLFNREIVVIAPPKGSPRTARARNAWRARRAKDRDYLARKRRPTDPIPASPVQRHLRWLEADGAKRTAIATTDGVSLGLVRQLLNGACDQLERAHAKALLAFTADSCLERANQTGSRGRPTSPDNERVDITSTLELLADLDARGFGRAWVSRELGYAGGLQLDRRRISRRLADAIADLHTQVGSLRSPVIGRTQRVPSLAEIQAGTVPAVPQLRSPAPSPRRHRRPSRRPAHHDEERSTTERRCPRYRSTRTRADLYRNPTTGDGLSPWCKPCHNEIGFQPVRP